MADKGDFYQQLGLRRNASAEEVRQAYFEAARRLHPDRNTAPGDTEFFLDVQEAYEVLSNPRKRAKYDASLPPEQPDNAPLNQTVLFSRQALARLDEPQLMYALLEFAAPERAQEKPRRFLNLCLVLDRSTSMQGGNMDMVKATAIQIMRRLRAEDLFSVVTFSDRAEKIIPASRGTDLAKLESRIHMLQPSGGTEIFQGLEKGYNEIIRHANPERATHIILLTDGRTYGDEENCLELARRAAEKGVGISGLGIGSEWNDAFLDELATLTGGSSMYVARPGDLQKSLLDKITQLGSAHAQETRLDYTLADGTELRYAFRLQSEPGVLGLASPLLMGPIGRETSLKVVLEFVVQPLGAERRSVTLLEGSLAPGIPEAKPLKVRLERPVLETMGADLPPAGIMEALAQLKLYRLQEQARLEVNAGEFEQATEHLHRLASHLLSQGERGLARTVLLEAEHIQQKKSFSQAGRKEIKYGTRALVHPGGAEEP